MVLFNSDNIYYPNSIIHTATSNLSFIKMWKILKDMGIKNNKFFLTLLQPELEHIDPFKVDPNDTETQSKIINEVINNPWYYFREICRLDMSGKRFRLHRANLAFIWLFLNNINLILIMPRQLGKTMVSLACCAYAMFTRNTNTSIAMLTRSARVKLINISKLTNIRNMLPKYLHFKDPNKDKTNSQEIYYNFLENHYFAFVNRNDQLAAEALGRGLETAIQHWDEIAYFKYNYIALPAAISAMNAAVDEAKKNNQLHGLLFTSTAPSLNSKEGQYFFKEFISKAVMFNESFYDFSNHDELVSKIKKINPNRQIVLLEYNPLQVGKSYEWIREKTSMITDKDVIKRDYFNIPTYSENISVLSNDIVKKIKESEKEPLYIQTIKDYLFYWYIPESIVRSHIFKTIPIVLGVDGSENIGLDYTTLVFIDARDLSVIGLMRCNESNIITLAHLIAQMLIDNPNILSIIERNSVGVSVIDTILLDFQKKHINPFTRLYNAYIENHPIHSYELSKLLNLSTIATNRKLFGFRTTATSRNYLYKNTFNRIIKNNFNKIHDKMLINEIISLRIKNGRIDHDSSGHDDLVIAYLLACYSLLYSSKLDLYFGQSNINYEPLCNYQEEEKNQDKLDIMNISSIQEIVEDIKNTKKKLKSVKNDIEKVQLLHQLRFYESLIPDEKMYYIKEVLSKYELAHEPGKSKFKNISNNPLSIDQTLDQLSKL